MKKVHKQVKIKRYGSEVKDPKRNKTSLSWSIIREYRDFLSHAHYRDPYFDFMHLLTNYL